MSVGVIFGGKNCEHDISIITGVGTLNALSGAGYDTVPVYINGEGIWYSGGSMRDIAVFGDGGAKARKKWKRVRIEPACDGLLDVKGKRLATLDAAVLCTHGVGGEDGCLQGLLQLAGIPYTGSGVFASSAGMDKAVMKRLFEAAGLPVGPYRTVAAKNIDKSSLAEIVKELGYPLIVKPANLGSSIGIGIAKDDGELLRAAQTAAEYDNNLIVEKAFVDFTELNCAVLGRGKDNIASGIEQPVGWTEFLSFDDKYTDIGAKRGKGQRSASRMQAKISDEIKSRVKSLAKQAFECIGASGVARVDFLLDGDSLYVNEINTIPGSLSYYLFEFEGLGFAELLEKLIRLAKDEDEGRKRLTYVYKSNVLKSAGGVKK